MKKIIVTGGSGQLGNCIRKIAPDFELDYEFIFTDSQTLDITDENGVNEFFDTHKPDFCINASAYTAVDLAETESNKAFAVNAGGVAHLYLQIMFLTAIPIYAILKMILQIRAEYTEPRN
jgi:dTDP-4-dehydrorhamnose reductase